jgi:hypothetical protein
MENLQIDAQKASIVKNIISKKKITGREFLNCIRIKTIDNTQSIHITDGSIGVRIVIDSGCISDGVYIVLGYTTLNRMPSTILLKKTDIEFPDIDRIFQNCTTFIDDVLLVIHGAGIVPDNTANAARLYHKVNRVYQAQILAKLAPNKKEIVWSAYGFNSQGNLFLKNADMTAIIMPIDIDIDNIIPEPSPWDRFRDKL